MDQTERSLTIHESCLGRSHPRVVSLEPVSVGASERSSPHHRDAKVRARVALDVVDRVYPTCQMTILQHEDKEAFDQRSCITPEKAD